MLYMNEYDTIYFYFAPPNIIIDKAGCVRVCIFMF